MPAGSTTEGSTDTDSNPGAAVALTLMAAGARVSDGEGRVAQASLDRRTVEIGRELFERIGRGPRPVASRLVGEPVHRRDARRPPRQGAALPVHRRASGLAHRPRGPPPPCRVSGRGRRSRSLVAANSRLSSPRPVRHGKHGLRRAARYSAGVMARKFIAGATPAEAIQTVVGLRRRRAGVHGRPAGRGGDQRARSGCCTSKRASRCSATWTARSVQRPEIPLIDRDDHGPIPRVNLSLKLSSLTAHFEPIHAEKSIEHVAAAAAADSPARP